MEILNRNGFMADALVDYFIKKIKPYTLFGTGRLTRHQYMRNFAIAQCVNVGGSLLSSLFISFGFGLMLYFQGYNHNQSFNILAPWIVGVSLFFFAVCIVINIYAAIQRFHDLGRSGWWTLTLLAPLYNLYVLFYQLALTDGHETANEYGARTTEVKNKKAIEWFFVASLVLLVLSRL